MLGWLISVAFGLIAGALIGLLYKLLDGREKPTDFFSDLAIYALPQR